jgi:hypothetical protein
MWAPPCTFETEVLGSNFASRFLLRVLNFVFYISCVGGDIMTERSYTKENNSKFVALHAMKA